MKSERHLYSREKSKWVMCRHCHKEILRTDGINKGKYWLCPSCEGKRAAAQGGRR
jgi:Zn finger protein HypA/HybF involved in hydrogenase expression